MIKLFSLAAGNNDHMTQFLNMTFWKLSFTCRALHSPTTKHTYIPSQWRLLYLIVFLQPVDSRFGWLLPNLINVRSLIARLFWYVSHNAQPIREGELLNILFKLHSNLYIKDTQGNFKQLPLISSCSLYMLNLYALFINGGNEAALYRQWFVI
jgi:hypothetical protein